MAETLKVNLTAPDGAILAQAAALVRQGGVIVYPTETIYGIGADALSPHAVQRVISAKRRRDGKPILVITSTMDWVFRLTRDRSPEAARLMHAFWPGPLTLVFHAADGLPDALAQGSGTIGIRIPSSTFCLQLLNLFGGPLTSTSANLSGEQTGRTVDELRQALAPGIDLFLDAGPLPASPPSTVVDVSRTPPRVLRAGALPVDDLRRVVPDMEA